MMSDQELKFLQEEDTICNSMLHLSTAAAAHHHANATLESPLDKYAAAYSNSTKRQSPSQFQEPVSKRATLHPSSSPSTTAAAMDNHLHGFTKLPLPHSFQADSPPPLRRTLSEPIYSPNAANSAAPPPKMPEFPTSPCPISNQTRQENPNRNIVQESAQFLNPVAILHRTVSDPSPVVHHQGAAASSTPPRPPVGRNASRSPTCEESPSTKRLKRMRERLKEMSQWWNQVVSEDDEEEEEEPEYYCCDNNGKEESEKVEEIPSQEAVWVEKKGDCLVLHFKCPCGNGYQILLSGKNCYYKLTNL